MRRLFCVCFGVLLILAGASVHAQDATPTPAPPTVTPTLYPLATATYGVQPPLQITIPTTNPDLPLDVFELTRTSPSTNEELALDSGITLEFSRVLDCESVLNAVSIAPLVAGEWDCRINTLYFIPAENFTEMTTYTVRVESSLRAASGETLSESLTQHFSTPGFLRVIEILPRDGSEDILGLTPITVVFNRPVVPLVTASEQENLPNPLTITPALSGTGEWLNTFVYTFTPSEPMLPGTTYTVSLDETLTTPEGARLAETYSWSFSTDVPKLVNISPKDTGTDVFLDATIEFDFTVPMPTDAVEANFYLRPIDEAPDVRVAGTWEWNAAKTHASFKPDDLLALETIYLAKLDFVAIGAAMNGVLLEGISQWTFTTLPYPRFLSHSPEDGATNTSGGFNLEFNTYMDAESITERLTIDPAPPEGFFNGYQSYKHYVGSFPWHPRQTYHITIEPGYSDIYGNVIHERIDFTYTTAPLSPDIYLAIPSLVGFYNGYYDSTLVYLQHRNVNRVGMGLYSVPVNEFVRRATSNDASYYNRGLYEYEPTHPQNLLRYAEIDLVGLDDGYNPTPLLPAVQNFECGTAPAARLQVGSLAKIIGDVPLYLKPGGLIQTRPWEMTAIPDAQATPTFTPMPDATLVPTATPVQAVVLYPNFVVSIIGDPQCDGNTRLWHVRLDDGSTGWLPENEEEIYLLEPTSVEETSVEIANSETKLAPGIYYLRVDRLEPRENNRLESESHFMLVSTAVLTIKASRKEVFVWATDVSSGEPIANAPITLYNAQGIFAGGLTDYEGVLRVPLETNTSAFGTTYYAVLNTEQHFGIGSTDWAGGIDPGNFGVNTEYYRGAENDYRIYLYTDRAAYRPGETVYYRGIVRYKDDMDYFVPEERTITVSYHNGIENIERRVRLSPYGTFSGEIKLAAESQVGGYYNIRAEITDDIANQISFSVGEFRLPEFEVNLTPAQDDVVQGDTVQVWVEGDYYFGAPVANARVEYRVMAESYTFQYAGEGRYSFYNYNFYDYRDAYPYGRMLAEGEGVTDAAGKFLIELPADLIEAGRSQNYVIEAEVRDNSNNTVAKQVRVVIHAGEAYIGSRPERYISKAGEETTVNLIAVDLDSQPLAGQPLAVEAVAVRWSNVQERDDAGRTAWVWEQELVPVAEGEIVTAEDGTAQFAFTPEIGGSYQIVTTMRDSKNNLITNIATIWVSSREYVSWRQPNNNRIELITDAENYKVGDTAQILIASPFQGKVQALITVERASIITYDIVELENNSYVYELPILPDYAPNIFVSVLLIKGVDENNPVAGFRMGMVALPVDTDQKWMTLDIQADTPQAQPGDTVTYTITAKNYLGEPVEAEIGVALTDAAALAIGYNNAADLLAFFYSEVGVSFRTGTPLTINTDQLSQQILDAIKGGGGGGGMALPFNFDVRDDFVATTYWNAFLKTDAEGKATFDVTLPDNLTTWRLDARAITLADDGNMLVGQTTYNLTSTLPLLIRPVTPRFLVIHDEVEFAAVVNNNTDEAVSATVLLEAEGIRLLNDADHAQTVVIPARGSVRVNWRAVVLNVEGVELVFAVESDDKRYQDASRPTLGEGENQIIPVYRYEVPETVATGGMLTQEGFRTETIQLPETMIVENGELTLRLETSLAASTTDALTYLENYHDLSIPGVVNRLLPNLMTYRALHQLELSDARLAARLDSELDYALQRLYNEQRSDGGWGWYWRENSDVTTTAYALLALAEAQTQGFYVDLETIARAQGFLSNYLIVPDFTQPNYLLNRQAFILYALAISGRSDNARLANLYEQRGRLNLDAQIFLALALHQAQPQNTQRINTLLNDIVSQGRLVATGFHWSESFADRWNWSSDTRTTALGLKLMITLDPESELIPQIVRWLMIARKDAYWTTTQETAWSLMALTDWMVLSGELQPNFSYQVRFNDTALLVEDATPETLRDTEILTLQVADLLAQNALRIERGAGDGVLYYNAHLRLFVPVPDIKAMDRGIIIQRQYSLLYDEDETPITEAKPGDLIRVRLTIIAPQTLHYLTIIDPLPAGAEAIDPALAISPRFDTYSMFSREEAYWYGWGWWYFQQREFRDEEVGLNVSYLPAGTYQFTYTMRAGLPGVYNVIPAQAYEEYFPEVFGRTDGMAFTILPEVANP